MPDLSSVLTKDEEITLRRIALGVSSVEKLSAADVKRLRELRLVQGEGQACRLTTLGRQHYTGLARPVLGGASFDLSTAVDKILGEKRKPKRRSGGRRKSAMSSSDVAEAADE
jgi:hypothetical protein